MNYIGELYTDKELLENGKRILIYGGGGGYGEKIYRNLLLHKKKKNIVAFVDKNQSLHGAILHGIPIISVEEAVEKYNDTIICIGGDVKAGVMSLELLKEMRNVHQITFNADCDFWGTEYGGFYLPKNLVIKDTITYSFGIGEDLSFSEMIIDHGGKVYAFDPTPKAINYVENHKLFSHPNFRFFPYGLSDNDGKEVFYLPVRDDWVSASVISHECVNTENKIEVNMKTLRTLMAEMGHKHIDILKMDIEGSEFKVIEDLADSGLTDCDISLCAMELHQRFFGAKGKQCADKLYNSMSKMGLYDIYGTDEEPVFLKIGKWCTGDNLTW